uniref:Uncharacterized protein n=1 Tax=Nelumbo nucifera TaxID=4432 RepID=A0A822XW03_NELNU|nr:TPA_asm: hypothetical protein HUJ06_025984 [Nelumbo nucifera]
MSSLFHLDFEPTLLNCQEDSIREHTNPRSLRKDQIHNDNLSRLWKSFPTVLQ